MKVLIFSVLSLLLSATFKSSAEEFYPEQEALKMVKIALKEKDIALVKKVDVADFFEKTDFVVIYRISRIGGDDFYAVFAQAAGRYEKFDYMITVNLDFAIEKIRVLKYRSEHGGEITSKKWLQQFENYSSGELRYKKEISALSGATMSAKSLTADVPRVLKILKKSCE